MIKKINNINDVEAFAKQIISEGVSFHPDDDFNDYVVLKTNKPCYTKSEADDRNELMNQCFEVCKKNSVDIYDVMNEVLLKETHLDKFIPLPSSNISEK